MEEGVACRVGRVGVRHIRHFTVVRTLEVVVLATTKVDGRVLCWACTCVGTDF